MSMSKIYVTLVDKTSNEGAIIDLATLLNHTLPATNTKNQDKYQELAFETKQKWQLHNIISFHQSCLLQQSSLTCLTKG